MKIGVFGTGYVGLVTGTCLANLGHDVICLDIDESKIKKLEAGEIPFFEPGLKELVQRNTYEKRLTFTTDSKATIENSDILFICVGTPSDDDGKADLSHVFSVAKEIGTNMNAYKVVVDKSTVPVCTADKVKDIITENTKFDVDLVSNPEFLREGEAVGDFMNPDRIVIGVESDKAKTIMTKIYKGIERTGKPILLTDIKTAELIKYASNAFLATKITFMNELAHLCEAVGGDVKLVSRGMGLDSRIAPRFLQAGLGYGGSCFPKDVKALYHTAHEHGYEFKILKAVNEVNVKQRLVAVKKAIELLGDLKNKKIAIWGIAFKPKTDDIREAPSITIIEELQKHGASIKAFDPVATTNAKKVLKDVEYGSDPYETVKGADCLVIVTEWNEFRYLSLQKIKNLMKQPNIVDGRNIYDPEDMTEFNYRGIGR